VFIEAKDDGSGGDNWSYKSCKAPVKSSPPTNQHPVFTGRMPFLSPNHLQLIKVRPSCAPGKGVWGGAKIVGSASRQPARSVCVASERFFHYYCIHVISFSALTLFAVESIPLGAVAQIPLSEFPMSSSPSFRHAFYLFLSLSSPLLLSTPALSPILAPSPVESWHVGATTGKFLANLNVCTCILMCIVYVENSHALCKTWIYCHYFCFGHI